MIVWHYIDIIFFLEYSKPCVEGLTHWGRVTHKCVSKLTIIGSDNGLSPGWRQAIIWTNAGILLIGPLGTNFSEILIEIYTFSLKRNHLKVSSGKMAAILSRPQCVNTLRQRQNGRHFADDISKQIFVNENGWILIKISLKFLPRSPINNILALFQIMAWRRPGDKLLFEPKMAYATYVSLGLNELMSPICAHITCICPYHVSLNILLNLCYTLHLYSMF